MPGLFSKDVFRQRLMSQKPSPQRPVQPRVSSGIPWWLWGLLLIVGGGTAISVVIKLLPNDPEKLYQDALTGVENKNVELLEQNLKKLKKFPNYARQQKLLEGISLLGGSRPLLAVPPLTEAAGDENDPNKELRSQALQYLGNAYAQADQRITAIQIFETMLKEDPDSIIARQNIAAILMEMMAWEEALEHLDLLVEKKFKPAQVLNMRGEIRMGLEQYKEAAEDFEGAVAADPTDPMNVTKSTKLVDCLVKAGSFEKAAEIAASGQQLVAQSTASAEMLLQKEDLDGALSALELIRAESPNALAPSRTFARIMLKYNTKEKAEEGLVSLRGAVMYSTRDIELYRLMAELAQIAGETDLAGLAQQNVVLLDAMNNDFKQRLAEVIKTRDAYEPRLQLADLAVATGRWELAMKIYDGMIRYFPDRDSEIEPKKLAMQEPLPQLVSTAVGGNQNDPRIPPGAPGPGKPE